MLTLNVEGQEFFDEENQVFISHDGFTLNLEHSLVSVSKWEARFCKPFLSTSDKTSEETLAYIEAMILDDDYPEDLLTKLSTSDIAKVSNYIESPASATTFSDLNPNKPSGRGQTITAELVYYWMVAHTIPFECETWHLNRLFALIRICNMKNGPQKKMTPGEIAARNRELNAQRKAQMGTSG